MKIVAKKHSMNTRFFDRKGKDISHELRCKRINITMLPGEEITAHMVVVLDEIDIEVDDERILKDGVTG